MVTAALADVRRSSASEQRVPEPAATQVREVQDASPAFESPAKAPTAPAIALPTVAPAAPQVEAPGGDPESTDHGSQADTEAFVEQMQQLRDEVARLKQDLGQARADSQTMVLRDVDRHVAGIGAQLAENQAEHREEAEAAQRAAAQRHEAVQILFAANGRLAAGDSHVLDSLEAAAPALPYPAQSALVRARESIQSEDLYVARYWIGIAIAESGWSQIVQ